MIYVICISAILVINLILTLFCVNIRWQTIALVLMGLAGYIATMLLTNDIQSGWVILATGVSLGWMFDCVSFNPKVKYAEVIA